MWGVMLHQGSGLKWQLWNKKKHCFSAFIASPTLEKSSFSPIIHLSPTLPTKLRPSVQFAEVSLEEV